MLHSLHLHEPVVRVPLLIKGPDVRPGRIDRPVHAVDVFPTVLQLLGLEAAGDTQGRSIFADDVRPIVTEWYASENPRPLEPDMGGRFDRDLRTYREGRHKLFVDSRGATELYDLVADPGEQHDLSGSEPALLERLRSGLDHWLATHPPATRLTAPVHETLSEEQKKRLRALGYLD